MTTAPQGPTTQHSAPEMLSGEEYRFVENYLLGGDPHLSVLRNAGIIKAQSLQELHGRLAATITALTTAKEEAEGRVEEWRLKCMEADGRAEAAESALAEARSQART